MAKMYASFEHERNASIISGPKSGTRRNLMESFDMDRLDGQLATAVARRRVLAAMAMGGVGVATAPLWAQTLYDLGLPGKLAGRPLTSGFPGKGQMILQRTRPPLLETPFEVFDQGVFTPNDRFFVRWHWASLPETIDPATFRLKVRGAVNREIELTISQLLNDFERIEYAAINQCAGNSRGLFQPSVAGAEWANGAMGNAVWTGVRLKDVLDKAGVSPGAVDVRMGGLDDALVPEGPKFLKSLAVDHARDGEVMIAFAMNGEQLPMLNGFPLRLVVPGWFSTYWIKALNDIEVLSAPDDQFWMAKAYLIPTTPYGSIPPGTKDFAKEPINQMAPRSFVTNLRRGQSVEAGAPLAVSGIAMGGGTGVGRVDVSIDGGKTWAPTKLGKDEGKHSFRRFDAQVKAPANGEFVVMTRCTDSEKVSQPMDPVWNPSGYMQSVIERLNLVAGDRS